MQSPKNLWRENVVIGRKEKTFAAHEGEEGGKESSQNRRKIINRFAQFGKEVARFGEMMKESDASMVEFHRGLLHLEVKKYDDELAACTAKPAELLVTLSHYREDRKTEWKRS